MILKYKQEQIEQILEYLNVLENKSGIRNSSNLVNIVAILQNPLKDDENKEE